MLIKYDAADAVMEPYSLDLLWQKSVSNTRAAERTFLVTGNANFLSAKEKSEEFGVIGAEFSIS